MTGSDFDRAAWERRLERHRAEKDEFLTESDHSPIPVEERESFDGLAYFPLDPTYRIEARIGWAHSPESVSFRMSRGQDTEYEWVGTVGFDLADDHRTLSVYRSPGVDDFFVPFRDATNGETTWKHGRYLGLDADRETVENGASVVLDFNLAYHPFCVYTEEYVAALPPTENELDIPISAGERLQAGTSAASSSS
ncbi:MAG: DUF1684 domain-containing protein [Halodesulfurarchaeum sp.]